MYNKILDLIIFCFYIYSILIFYIKIKPNFIINLIFLIYFLISTYIILNGDKENKCILFHKYKKFFILVIIFYSLISLLFFNIIHYTWKRYKNNYFYLTFLILLPLFYFIGSLIAPIFFNCNYSFLDFYLNYLKNYL